MKLFQKTVATIIMAITYGLMINYTNVDVAIVCLLIQIYIETLFKEKE